MRISHFLSVLSVSTTAIIAGIGLSLVPARALQISPTAAASAGNDAIIQVRDHNGGRSGVSTGARGGSGSVFHAYSGSAKTFSSGNFQNFRTRNEQNFRNGNIRANSLRANNIQVYRPTRNNPNFNQNFVRSSRLAHHHHHHRRFVGIPYFYDDYGYDYSDYSNYDYGDEPCYRLVPRWRHGHRVWRRIYVCS
jgi:hypothetical protein